MTISRMRYRRPLTTSLTLYIEKASIAINENSDEQQDGFALTRTKYINKRTALHRLTYTNRGQASHTYKNSERSTLIWKSKISPRRQTLIIDGVSPTNFVNGRHPSPRTKERTLKRSYVNKYKPKKLRQHFASRQSCHPRTATCRRIDFKQLQPARHAKLASQAPLSVKKPCRKTFSTLLTRS